MQRKNILHEYFQPKTGVGERGNVFTHFKESRVSDIILDTMYKDPNEPINSDWSPPLTSVGAFVKRLYNDRYGLFANRVDTHHPAP